MKSNYCTLYPHVPGWEILSKGWKKGDRFQTVCPGKAGYGYENSLKALEVAVQIFGRGHVYTNFVYGIQSLNASLDPASYNPQKENARALDAVKGILSLSVILGFKLYQYGSSNSIGQLTLNASGAASFFLEWGELVKEAQIVSQEQKSVLFGLLSFCQTPYLTMHIV